mmetsp:Transcript_10491/g.24310  ORF Transcript_10491/g.24310 Transcript_10491/m.24310 type:complete len:111 (+) Transcript_10491:748-1080(+)
MTMLQKSIYRNILIFDCLDLGNMALLHYIIWDPEPTIFKLGSFAVRWYGLCILLAFLGGRQIIRFVYQKEGRPLEDADHFSTWILCAALIGARFGEVFFLRSQLLPPSSY